MYFDEVMYYPDTRKEFQNIYYDVPSLKAESIKERLRAVIMQYTGLKDKNKKDIYEGDIVNGIEFSPFHPKENIDNTIGEIVFDETLFGYCITDGNKPICHMDEIEIIGNIYENPELL